MPPQPSTLNPPPLADEVPDTYLRKHDVVHCFGRDCRVAKIKIGAATIIPVGSRADIDTPHSAFRTPRLDGDVISPNSPLDILGTYDPATRTVKWRGVPQASPPASQPGVSARCSANDSTILNGLPGKVDAGDATTVANAPATGREAAPSGQAVHPQPKRKCDSHPRFLEQTSLL